MRIDFIVCPAEIIEKLATKHNVSVIISSREMSAKERKAYGRK
jgi:uncharacterized DUF497 family protein